MRVLAEMVREERDALSEQRNLHLGGASVSLVRLEVVDDLLTAFRSDDRCYASGPVPYATYTLSA